MKQFFERAQDVEGCPTCVKHAAERMNSKGGYTWFGALRGWDSGCRACYDRIEALRVSPEVSKESV